MYCKYCGSNIPDGSAVCPNCGKSLKFRPALIAGGPLAFVPFFLLFAILYVPILLNVVIYPRTLLSLTIISPILGGLILYFGIKRENIDLTRYCYSDVLVLACFWLLFSWVSGRFELFVIGAYGSDVVIAANSIFASATVLFRLPHAWVALGILLLGMGRKDIWRPTKEQLIAAAGVMLVLSLLGFIFAGLAAAIFGYGPWAEVRQMAASACRCWSLFSWLWPAAVLLIFSQMGSDRIGPVAAILAFLGMTLGEILLVPIFVATLHLGIIGLGLARGLSPIFALLITLVFLKVRSNRARL